MKAAVRHQESGAYEFRGHCIHNDQPAPTRNFSLSGLLGAILWIAIWTIAIMAVVSDDLRSRHRAAGYWNSRNQGTLSDGGRPLRTISGYPAHRVEWPER
jgi:hypothetical protein